MKENEMQGQSQTVQNLDKRRLHFEKSIRDQTHNMMGRDKAKGRDGTKTHTRKRNKEVDDPVLEIRRDVDGLKRLIMKMHYKGRGTLGTCKSFVNQQWKHTELCDNLCDKKPPTTVCL